MLKKRMFLSLLAVCFSAHSALADTAVSQDAVKSLNVTVYNNGLGLVKDSRSVDLKKGENTLSFQGVSAQIQPETALLEGSGLKVREQNFNFDLLSRESLLRKFLGKDIQVIETHYISGKKTIENAKVLSVDAGLVLKIGDRIETDYSGRLIFPDIPANLYDQPTLTVNVAADDSGKRDIELSYLTNGLTWRADYVAELNDAEDALNLNGWVTLTNTSGIAYNNGHSVCRGFRQPRPSPCRPQTDDAESAQYGFCGIRLGRRRNDRRTVNGLPFIFFGPQNGYCFKPDKTAGLAVGFGRKSQKRIQIYQYCARLPGTRQFRRI